MPRNRKAVSFSPSRVLGALGRRRKDALRAARYAPLRRAPLVEAVLFESFAGKMIGDNPYYVYAELAGRDPGLEVLWTVADAGMAAPAGTRAVVHGTPEWLEGLGTSRFLVNNTNFPPYFRKREGQVYLQTWHGTPLKRLGHDITTGTITGAYLAMMDREAAAWDFLITANPFSTTVLARAFRYGGRILETGYPRNDPLVLATPAERERIRASLGVDPDTKLLLYGPTWRDTNRTALGKWAAVNYLDPGRPLPPGWRLAFRGHSNTHAAHDGAIAAGALDVTLHPNVSELLVAADALLTDYSSLMFDFAVTGKPILFLTPDLEDYEATRGFYFDFRAAAPGPLLRDPAQVGEALADLPAVVAESAERYRAFRERFAVLEDGHASARVVDEVFGT